MEIKRIEENKKQFMDLLLLADEQESMIDNIWNEEICLPCTMTA